METGKKKNRNVKKRERDILIAKADTPKVLRICEKQWKVIKRLILEPCWGCCGSG